MRRERRTADDVDRRIAARDVGRSTASHQHLRVDRPSEMVRALKTPQLTPAGRPPAPREARAR